MSDTPWTPGPWAYRPRELDDWGIVRSGDDFICQARDPRNVDDEILNAHRRAKTDPWAANARLIAAAPELAEALEMLDAWWTAEETGPDYGGLTRDTHPNGELVWRAWWDNNIDLCRRTHLAARAALAKARGETP